MMVIALCASQLLCEIDLFWLAPCGALLTPKLPLLVGITSHSGMLCTVGFGSYTTTWKQCNIDLRKYFVLEHYCELHTYNKAV